MKKLFSLLLAAVMLMSCAAFAEGILGEDPEAVLSFDKESPVTDWEGTWVLAAAYIGEDFAEENEIATTGLIAVPEKAATMNVKAILDGSATGSDAGVMVDQGSYTHAHVYDMEAEVTFAEGIASETATLRLPWDGWKFTVRGENDGDFNMGVGKLSKVGCDDKSLYFGAVTGVENEGISDESMKYVGMSEGGRLIVCYSDDNLVKKDGDVAFAYIFVRAE